MSIYNNSARDIQVLKQTETSNQSPSLDIRERDCDRETSREAGCDCGGVLPMPIHSMSKMRVIQRL